jgi:hypothetical protein
MVAGLLTISRPPYAGGKPCRNLEVAHCLGTTTALKRTLSPLQVQLATRLPTSVLRLDVHPADFDYPGQISVIESILERANARNAVTYDELALSFWRLKKEVTSRSID